MTPDPVPTPAPEPDRVEQSSYVAASGTKAASRRRALRAAEVSATD